MLSFLSIKNYAIIDSLEIDFQKGFSTITGETGSGKSIIIGALSLLLGKRSDVSMLKNKNLKCIIEANFHANSDDIISFFQKNELDIETPIVIRREISPNGKTRSFINDTPVQLSLLKDFSSKIIDIHSQHQNLELQSNFFQLKVLDAFSRNEKTIAKFSTKFHDFKKIEKQYNNLLTSAEKTKADLDYFMFQFEQIDKLNLIDGEQEEIESSLSELNHAEEIKSKLFALSQNFAHNDDNVLNKINSIKVEISKLSSVFTKANEITKRLESIIVELRDIVDEAEKQEEKISYNPEQIEQLTQRLSDIFDLQQKHRVSSIKELINIKDELDNKIATINSFDDEILKLKKKKKEKELVLYNLANDIQAKRKASIPALEKKVNHLLQNLGISNAIFKINISENEELNEFGGNDINFLFSANQKIAPDNISKIASGGELSRLMLALKYTIFGSSLISSIVFDEIDLGVSGEISDKMGQLMAEMSKDIQVICITHLPQIASRGQFHYRVIKNEDTQDINIVIELLNKEERIIEIAKMLSAENLTDAAIENAKMLLSN